MHDEGRDSVTEYYPSKTGAIGALVFFLLMAALPGFVVFDGAENPVLRVFGGFAMVLFGFGVYAELAELWRPRPTLVVTDQGFTYRGYPHIAWVEVERLRLGIGRVGRGGKAERFAEVVLHDPVVFRDRVEAFGEPALRRNPDRPVFIVAERLRVPVGAVVEVMREHHPDLVVASTTDDDSDSAPGGAARSPDRDMVESALISALTDALPDTWDLAVLWFSLVGDEGHAGIQLKLPGDETDDVEPTEEMLALLNRLKEVCYDQMTGTWLSGQVILRSDSTKAQFTLSFKEIPEWLPVPEVDACRRELATYPRAGDEIPEWLRHRIS